MEEREALRQAFNSQFAQWKIELPTGAAAPGVVWLIVSAGWTIWTLFGNEDGREFLDYYATHRMTNDRHARIFAEGHEVGLPAIEGGYVVPQGATTEEEAELRARHFARNQEIERMLDDKGFVMTDKAPMSAQINRYLQTHPEAMDDPEQESNADAGGNDKP